MEVFAILFSIPAAFVANLLYCLLLVKVFSRNIRAQYWLRGCSYVVLSLLAIELLLLMTLGAVQSRSRIGPAFYDAHFVVFFLSTPALANLLVLPPKRETPGNHYLATILCTVLAFFLVLLQYGVYEALYGIDGEGGPYSSKSFQ